MDITNRLELPYILPSQAQKHVTHNEALRIIDSLVQLTVQNATTTLPEPNPVEGQCFIIPDDALGIWEGKSNQIAAWVDGSWMYSIPQTGWHAWDIDEAVMLIFSDVAGWQSLQVDATEETTKLGINATADEINRLSVNAASSLFNHDQSGDHRLKLNKEAEGGTAGVIFQSGFAGKAELGLAGTDHFSIKVSDDGANFQEGLVVDPQSAAVSFPNTNVLTDYAANLYADSGRFAGNDVNGISIGSFQFPGYLDSFNGATASGLAKFIHNNTDYGGTAGAMDPAVIELVEKTKDAGNFRRYGNEYWVCQISEGQLATPSSPFSFDGANGFLTLYAKQMIRMPAMTFHGYFKAESAPSIFRVFPGQTISVDGIAQAASYVLTPEQGWRSIQIHDIQQMKSSTGYWPSILNVYSATGAELLMACATLMPGITRTDPSVGIIASSSAWANL